MQKRKPEPAERVTRRVRAFRKRQREGLKQQNAYIWGVRSYFQDYGLKTEWALAGHVYESIEVLKVRISFEQFVEAVLGNKDKKIKPIKSLEISTLVGSGGEKILLIRPVKIPARRRRKTPA
jgi:hypothetical protein